MSAALTEQESAWLLHARPYQESALIADFLTQNYGRISTVVPWASGGRRRNGKPRKAHVMTQFSHLLISFKGRSELKRLTGVDALQQCRLKHHHLYSGFYLNELLLKLLLSHHPCPEIYALYQRTIYDLHSLKPLEPLLRSFEKRLLMLLGYALPLDYEAHSEQPIQNHILYFYQPEQGFSTAKSHHVSSQSSHCFSGIVLNALRQDNYFADYLPQMKRLMRYTFNHLLDGKVIKSRTLFSGYKSGEMKNGLTPTLFEDNCRLTI